jgi:SRSO17 transposase
MQGHSKFKAEQGQDGGRTDPGIGAQRRGEVEHAVLPQQAHHDIAYHRQRLGRVPRAHLARVLAKGHVPDPVQAILDVPMRPHEAQRLGWRGMGGQTDSAKAPELKYYLSSASADTPLAELLRVVGMRWPIECCFEEGKGELGMDQYELRFWRG